jgi:hypothetical protein
MRCNPHKYLNSYSPLSEGHSKSSVRGSVYLVIPVYAPQGSNAEWRKRPCAFDDDICEFSDYSPHRKPAPKVNYITYRLD